MKKVLYEELLPEECVQRIQEMPVAYLPLGTLEWHGPHMPLGADGIQSKELFVRVAEKVGGVVLPMLFMGPDRVFYDRGTAFYGMDINTEGALNTYCVQQMKGSAYWMEKGQFQDNLRSIFAQLSRAGIRIVVGHGHGPSTNAFQELKDCAVVWPVSGWGRNWPNRPPGGWTLSPACWKSLSVAISCWRTWTGPWRPWKRKRLISWMRRAAIAWARGGRAT